MPRSHGARIQAALAFESTYGTAPGAGFLQMPLVSSTLRGEQPLIADDRVGRGRDPDSPTLDALTVSGDMTVPLEVESIGVWLKALFGAPTTTEGTGPNEGVFTHVFQSGGWDLPSLAIEIGYPEVPSFGMFAGVRLDSLALSMERSGLTTARLALMGQSETLGVATAAGTPSALADARFTSFSGAVKRNGTALAGVTSAELTYANGLEPVEVLRADGLIDGLDSGRAALTGQIRTRFGDTVLLTQAINGDPCELEWSYERSATEKLTITAHRVFLPRPGREVPGPQGIMVDFDWQAARDDDPARMCTATLINGRASY